MNTFRILLWTVLAISLNVSCTAQAKKDDTSANISKSDKVDVYYFHYTRRCATCNAVETVSKEAIADFYGDKVTFSEYNLDEEGGKAKGIELKVSGQALLIVAGDTKINITSEGFMNARSNPDKLKTIIKEKIDPLL